MRFLKSIKISLILTAILAGCASDDDFGPLINQIEAATFTLNTPQGWELIEDQGIDTYVGRITGPKHTIFFDQGYLSFNNLDDITEDHRTLFLQKLEINDVPAIIHKERRFGDSGDVRLSVYLDNNGLKNRLYIFDPANEDLIMEIFKSHRFK